MIDYDFANGGIELKDRTHYAFGDNGKFEECLYEIAENLPERDSDYGNLKDSEK